jgi:hypothetical protein
VKFYSVDTRYISFVYTSHYFKLTCLDLIVFGLLNSVYQLNAWCLNFRDSFLLLKLHGLAVFSNKLQVVDTTKSYGK